MSFFVKKFVQLNLFVNIKKFKYDISVSKPVFAGCENKNRQKQRLIIIKGFCVPKLQKN
jgi:hypothetical protein